MKRRSFLKLLGAAPVAPIAIDVEKAIAAIPEPNIERITNYVDESLVKGINEVVELRWVVGVSLNPLVRTKRYRDMTASHTRTAFESATITIRPPDLSYVEIYSADVRTYSVKYLGLSFLLTGRSRATGWNIDGDSDPALTDINYQISLTEDPIIMQP